MKSNFCVLTDICATVGLKIGVSRLTETDRNGPKGTGTAPNGPERPETDLQNGYPNGQEQTSAHTETNFNGNQKR